MYVICTYLYLVVWQKKKKYVEFVAKYGWKNGVEISHIGAFIPEARVAGISTCYLLSLTYEGLDPLMKVL